MLLVFLAFGCVREGIDGAPGPAGPPGVDGIDGAQGAPGVNGIDGSDMPPGPHWVDSNDVAATITTDLVSVDDLGLVWGIDVETGDTYGIDGDDSVHTFYSGANCTGTVYVATAPAPLEPFRACGVDGAWHIRPRDLRLSDATLTPYASVWTPTQCYNAPGTAKLMRIAAFDRDDGIDPPDLGLVGPLRIVR